MLKIAGHIRKHYKPVCIIFEEFKNRGTTGATLDEYIKAVEKHAATYPDADRLSFKGDMFEILAEIFFKAFENSSTVGLREYTPIPLEEDYGVDGKGINAIGKQCAVQCKYRSNPLELVTYSEIARTYTSGRVQLGLNLEGADCIYVFTTALGVNIQCQTVFGDKVRVLNKDVIGREINNNVSFWALAFEEISNTLLS